MILIPFWFFTDTSSTGCPPITLALRRTGFPSGIPSTPHLQLGCNSTKNIHINNFKFSLNNL